MDTQRQQWIVNLVASRIMTKSRRPGGNDGNHLEQTTAVTFDPRKHALSRSERRLYLNPSSCDPRYMQSEPGQNVY